MLVRFDHVAGCIVNADRRILRSAVELRVCHRFANFQIQQPTEGQHVADEINARMILARMDFVGMRFLIGIIHRGIAAPECCDGPPRYFHGCRFALLTARSKKRLADICVSEMKTEIRLFLSSNAAIGRRRFLLRPANRLIPLRG